MIAQSKKRISVSHMTKIAMMGVLAFIIMQLSAPIPIFPTFLKLDVSDLPALIAAFAMGPLAGVLVSAIKNILHLLQTTTGGVGELANFFIASAITIPAALIYRRHKTKQSAIIGLIVGTITMAIAGGIANYFVLLPFYSKIMPVDIIINMGAVVNPNISNFETLVLYGVIPFNLVKGAVLSVITLLIYKHISPILHKGQ